MCICYRLLDVDLLLGKLACGPDREHFRQWYRATLDAMSERRTDLRREPWWGRAKIVGDRQFVARLIDKRHAKDIVELACPGVVPNLSQAAYSGRSRKDATCTWA